MADTANLEDGQVADVKFTPLKSDGVTPTTIDRKDRDPSVVVSHPDLVQINVSLDGDSAVNVEATAIGSAAEDTLVFIDVDCDADRDAGEDRAITGRATLVRKSAEAGSLGVDVVVRP